MAKPPAKKRPTAQSHSKGKTSGRPAGLFTWLAVGLVVVIIAVLVGVKVLSGSTSTTKTGFVAASPQIVGELTGIPQSVFDSIGVTSSTVGVTPPSVFKTDPLLTTTVNGKKVPEVLYIGAEYCPYCAAERWSTIIALSRFGTWSNLGDMASYSGDVYPNTQTFTFGEAKYTSKYLAFKSVEEYRSYLNSAGSYYATYQTPTKAQNALLTKYDSSAYFPGATGTSIPFISIGNKILVSGASYSPSALANLSREQIASTLSTPSNLVSQAIIATANYLTASICYITNQQPGSVCSSNGVEAATKALKL